MRWERVKKGRDGIEIGLPGKRWGHTFNSIRGGRLLYLFGGYGRDNCRTNQVHVFDTLSRSWSQPVVKGTPPIPRDSHTCTTIGDNLFVFGGTDGVTQLRDLHILDTCSNTWISPSVSGETPEPVEGHSAALIGTRLFIFGGCGKSKFSADGVCYNDLYILNTETFIWTRPVTSGTPPSARESHTCSSWGNKMIVIGGEDRNDYYFGDVHVLDTDTLVWKDLDVSGHSLPPLAGHSAVAFDKYLLVLGGFSNGQNLYGDLYMLDLGTCNWTKIYATGDGPSPRFFMAGDCLNPTVSGALAFIGGCNRSLETLDDMYFLYTDLVRESGRDERRLEKLSLRKLLKMKCQEPNIPALSIDKALVPFGSPDRHELVAISQDAMETATEDIIRKLIMKNISSLAMRHTRIKRARAFLSHMRNIRVKRSQAFLSHGEPPSEVLERLIRSDHIVLFCLKQFKRLLKKLPRVTSPGLLSLNPPANTKASTSDAPIVDTKEAATQGVSFGPFHSQMSEKDIINPVPGLLEKERFLCITEGFGIYCLDLKKTCPGIQLPPLISSLNLLSMGLPMSMGLFKQGPDTYMLGGQEFPDCKDPGLPRKPGFLYEMYGFKGSSRKTYRLSLTDGVSLSLSECGNIPSLNKPKIWPIIEKIGNHIHVIESFPRGIARSYPPVYASHEVLDLSDLNRGWTSLSPLRFPKDEELGMHIWKHLVVGERIYACALGIRGIVVFDSNTKKWEYHEDPSVFSIAENLDDGTGRCVGVHPQAKLSTPVYIVIEIISDLQEDTGHRQITAVADLVTQTGHVSCFQFLPHLFQELKTPCCISEATLFNVGEKGNTMCALVQGTQTDTDTDTEREFLFICTFNVEHIPDAVQDLLHGAPKSEEDDIPEEKFVNVVLKDSYIYELENDLWLSGRFPSRLRACFM